MSRTMLDEPDESGSVIPETKEVDGVLVRMPEGYPEEAKCPDCGHWYPWFDQEFCCFGCGWVPPAKRWSP